MPLGNEGLQYAPRRLDSRRFPVRNVAIAVRSALVQQANRQKSGLLVVRIANFGMKKPGPCGGVGHGNLSR